MTAFILYQVHSAEILQASAGKYNVGVFLGQEYNNCHDFRFKKAWYWLQKSQDNRLFVYTWYHFSFKVQSLVT